MSFETLSDPKASGVHVECGFGASDEVQAIYTETCDPNRVNWYDAHDTYINARGLTIVQNHFTFALRTDRGGRDFFEQLPSTVSMQQKIQSLIRSMSDDFPSLGDWEETELSFHLYDNQDIGLSKHRDNLRFVGLIAILGIDGIADLVVTDPSSNKDLVFTVEPGDLVLLRANGLIDSAEEIRPEHSVRNLRNATRTSMMMRQNIIPDDVVPGFRFNNWEPTLDD